MNLESPFNQGYYTSEQLRKMQFKYVGENVQIAKNSTIIGLENISLVTDRWMLFGEYDLIARVQADDEYDLTRCIVEDIRPMQGIVETKTLIGAEL